MAVTVAYTGISTNRGPRKNSEVDAQVNLRNMRKRRAGRLNGHMLSILGCLCTTAPEASVSLAVVSIPWGRLGGKCPGSP